MKIECPHCKSGYTVDDAKIPAKGAYTLCKNCGQRFLVKKNTGSGTPENSVPQKSATRQFSDTFETETDAAEKDQKFQASIDKQEQLVENYIKQDDQEAAAKLLFELIVKHAKEKNFHKAEALRNKLYEAAPMAVNEIVKSGEIIEEEKTQSIDQHHLKVWADLYNRLEPGEASELYYAMKTATLKAGQTAYKQGDTNSHLYFIQYGALNLSRYDQKDGEEKKITELKPGDITNIEPFFSFTVCTTSLTATTASELTYLEKSNLSKWKNTFPGLEPKLNSFCRSQKNLVSDLVKKIGTSLRAHERFIVSLKAVVQLLDNTGKPIHKPFRITVFDISAGGFSFALKINKKEQAAGYLGHRLYMRILHRVEGVNKKIGQKGRIVAVHLQPFGESSIHVQFQSPLDESLVASIAR